MPQNPSPSSRLGTLTDAEVEALAAGAAWYAKYHQRDVPADDADVSAAAVARREHFENLYSALDKLGVRLRRPVGVRSRAGSAA